MLVSQDAYSIICQGTQDTHISVLSMFQIGPTCFVFFLSISLFDFIIKSRGQNGPDTAHLGILPQSIKWIVHGVNLQIFMQSSWVLGISLVISSNILWGYQETRRGMSSISQADKLGSYTNQNKFCCIDFHICF